MRDFKYFVVIGAIFFIGFIILFIIMAWINAAGHYSNKEHCSPDMCCVSGYAVDEFGEYTGESCIFKQAELY